MLLTRLKVRNLYGLNTQVDFAPITIITGRTSSGKSLILNIVSSIIKKFQDRNLKLNLFKNSYLEIEFEIPEELRRRIIKKVNEVDLSFWNGKFSIVIEVNDHIDQCIKIENEVVLHIVQYQDSIYIRRPIETTLKDFQYNDYLIFNINFLKERIPDYVTIFSESEQILSITFKLVTELIDFLKNINCIFIGPYIDYNTCLDVQEYLSNYVGKHGEYTTYVLAKVFSNPKMLNYVKFLSKILSGFGIKNFRVGWFGNKISMAYIDKFGNVITCPEISCQIKTLITIFTQLVTLDHYSILIIDNADYCLTDETLNVLSKVIKSILSEKKIQLILELHNQEFTKHFTQEYTLIHSL